MFRSDVFSKFVILELGREARLAPTVPPWAPCPSLGIPCQHICPTICTPLRAAHEFYQGWHPCTDEETEFCRQGRWEDLDCKVTWKDAYPCGFDMWSRPAIGKRKGWILVLRLAGILKLWGISGYEATQKVFLFHPFISQNFPGLLIFLKEMP